MSSNGDLIYLCIIAVNVLVTLEESIFHSFISTSDIFLSLLHVAQAERTLGQSQLMS